MKNLTTLLKRGILSSVLLLSAATAQSAKDFNRTASTITTPDNVEIYYKDWGPKDGEDVTFSHGWPLNSDSWESQMQFLAEKGYLVIAHDRRGYGRSSQPWEGNDMDHYADDLAAVIETLKLDKITLVVFPQAEAK